MKTCRGNIMTKLIGDTEFIDLPLYSGKGINLYSAGELLLM